MVDGKKITVNGSNLLLKRLKMKKFYLEVTNNNLVINKINQHLNYQPVMLNEYPSLNRSEI